MGWTNDLLTGVAERLAAAGVGVWRPAGPAYTDDETAIVVGSLPQQPSTVVALAAYAVTASAALNDTTIGVQARIRGVSGGDQRPAADLADAVFEALHGLRQQTIGGIWVAQITLQSSAQLGPDQQGRDERTDNYYMQAARPTAGRTE
jgi:Bacteriophage minor capsid protein